MMKEGRGEIHTYRYFYIEIATTEHIVVTSSNRIFQESFNFQLLKNKLRAQVSFEFPEFALKSF